MYIFNTLMRMYLRVTTHFFRVKQKGVELQQADYNRKSGRTSSQGHFEIVFAREQRYQLRKKQRELYQEGVCEDRKPLNAFPFIGVSQCTWYTTKETITPNMNTARTYRSFVFS